MRKRLATGIACGIAAFGVCSGADNSQTRRPYFLTFGADKSLCRQALVNVRKLSTQDLLDGNVSPTFNSDRWSTSSIEWTDNSGTRRPSDFKYQVFDLDNDGTNEIVIEWKGNVRLMEYHYWDVMTEEEFSNARTNGIVGATYVPWHLNGQHIDADERGLGYWMAPWKYQQKDYVVFVPSYLPAARQAAFILVTEYKKDPYGDGGRWFPMKVLCGISNRKNAVPNM
jgi:hypothetical protein